MSVEIPSPDNRRLIVRVFAREFLSGLRALGKARNTDTIALILFTGIWSANTQHLTPPRNRRYAETMDIPPDSQRTPISLADLVEQTGVPRAIAATYVREMLDGGILEMWETGLVVPSAVIARLETVESLTETHEHLVGMVSALQSAGLRFDSGPNAVRLRKK